PAAPALEPDLAAALDEPASWDRMRWAAIDPACQASIERSAAGAWERISPWMSPAVQRFATAPAGDRSYRLVVRDRFGQSTASAALSLV
ncbi:MAG TPA: hypothetical protein VGD80_26345, partial [Kofleriaceae bacterium]